jgi:hypothetical protein
MEVESVKMNKQESLDILEKILGKSKNYEYLWEGNLSPIQEASPIDFAYRKENKLNVFGFWSNYQKSIRFAPSKGGYVSIMKNKHTLDKTNDFCYVFNGNFFFPEETNIPKTPEDVYGLLMKIHKGEKSPEINISEEIIRMREFFEEGIKKALKSTRKDEDAFA